MFGFSRGLAIAITSRIDRRGDKDLARKLPIAALQSAAMRFISLFAILVIATLAFAQNEVEITSEPHHHLALENQYVRVFKVEVAPREATLMHRHRHDYMFVTLGDTQVENDVAGKQPVTLKLANGETRFTRGDFAHIAKNLSDTPFRNVTIELLQDEQAKKAPVQWDEDRGLHVFTGGTQDILFVKDNARASEVELQPGGVVPSHRHKGPHLLIAVSDLDLRSEEGKSATPVQMRSGDIKWVPGGFTHSVTNVGKNAAKLVTVEFP
jgi:quercetin dioxygenase-like cupin family protein